MSTKSRSTSSLAERRAPIVVVIVVVIVALAAAACASESPSTGARVLPSFDGSFDPDGGTCASVALEGPTIVSTCSGTEPPQPQGGALADGTYVLASMTYYGACPSSPDRVRQTWVISGDQWYTAQEFLASNDHPDAGSIVWQIATTGMAQDASAVERVTCGPAAMGITANTPLSWDGYDATPGHLVIYSYTSSDLGSLRADSYVQK